MPEYDEQETVRQAAIRTELNELSSERVDLDMYRDYYDGDQKINFGTEKFQQQFGDTFEGFHDNWCRTVTEASSDKLEVEAFIIGRNDEDRTAYADTSEAIWQFMSQVDIDEKQDSLHVGAINEGRAAMIVWPDPETGLQIDMQPAATVRVTYSEENPNRVVRAIKHWQGATGDTYLTLYTPEALFKYIDTSGSNTTKSDPTRTPYDMIPDQANSTGLRPRKVSGEPWPLPNPYNEVPVIEFLNRRALSDLKDVIPMQDALNYVLTQMFVAAEFGAFPQRLIITKQNEPSGGFSNVPGRVWKLEPIPDMDGKFVMPEFGSFDTMDPSIYIKIVDMFLQHIAATSKVPRRYFLQADRSGRGDAPSGESLKVEDKPLLDKVAKKAVLMGNRWYRLFTLAGRMLADNPKIRPQLSLPGSFNGTFPHGEPVWRDWRLDYRGAALAEAQAMMAVGLPVPFVWKYIGLTPAEIAEATELYEAEKEEKRQEAEREAERAMSLRSSDGIMRAPQDRTGPRPTQ